MTFPTRPRNGEAPGTADSEPYRVLLVDDSAVYRGLVRREIAKCPDIAVVGACGDGASAVRTLRTTEVDVVVLDIEMPVMDGLTALPQLIEARPTAKVIMASTLTERNADISLRALQMGAAETIAKPTSTGLGSDAERFVEELIRKIRALGDAARRAQVRLERRAATGLASRPAVPAARARASAVAEAGTGQTGADYTLRPAPTRAPTLIAIGSSTGGPKALITMLETMTKTVRVPIVITQHMPATFTSILAAHIARATGRKTFEATEGMPVHAEHIYIAPGDFHMTLRRDARGGITLHLDQGPPENFCRPAVDPMLRSVATTFGPNALAIILTGMGHDGAKGAKDLVAAGGSVIAQDQATSVVWGMPQAAAKTGVCSAVLPLEEIAPYVAKLAMRHAA
ncbi:MAG: chemotaxis response regulator protein-glutamate methylesterase [Alphaproteobacteria bacterium]